jgi:hypothetical protein
VHFTPARLQYDLTMERVIATINDNGELTLLAEVSAAFGFGAGSEVEIVFDGSSIGLHKRGPRLLAEELNRAFSEMQALLAGGPSLEDELYKMRREE